MKNKEVCQKINEVHVYLAIKRKKDNKQSGKKVFRQIVYNKDLDLKILKEKCKSIQGIWRIYRTVNKRDLLKAKKMFIHELLDTDRLDLDSLWRKIILQPINKSEKNILLDLDDKKKYNDLLDIINKNGLKIKEQIQTVNGFHIVLEKCDTRLFEGFKDLEILRDGYIFVEIFNA